MFLISTNSRFNLFKIKFQNILFKLDCLRLFYQISLKNINEENHERIHYVFKNINTTSKHRVNSVKRLRIYQF